MAFDTFLILSLMHTAVGLQSSDHLMVFATLGDDVILPCSIPDIKSCSSMNWTMAGAFGSASEVVRAGRVMPSNTLRLILQWDCSLKISQLTLDNARIYTCSHGALNASVSLHILEVTESLVPADDILELQCFLNTYKGHLSCKNRGMHIEWSSEDNTPLKGSRFTFVNPSECFSKLVIHKKPTDHQRKWKCRLFQNGTLKAATSHTTTIKDGIEEVFAAVGESVSLSCQNTSSVIEGESVRWAMSGQVLPGDITTHKGSSTLLISKVTALHAGEYQCLGSTGAEKVLNTIRLYTLDVASECKPGGYNLTLSCVLTCVRKCGQDFGLTWSGSGESHMRSDSVNENNTLRDNVVLSTSSVSLDELTCFVLREGGVVKSKRWRTITTLQTPASAWLTLPLVLLICVAAGGLYMQKKRRHKRDSGTEQSDTGMTPIYNEIQDATEEDQQQQRQLKVETNTTTDSFYELLQAVN